MGHFSLKFRFNKSLLLIIVSALLFYPKVVSADLESVVEGNIEEKTDVTSVSVEENSKDPRSLTLKLADGRRIEFVSKEISEGGQKKFESLGEKERDSFLRNRELLLGVVGKLLDSFKTPIGIVKRLGTRFSSARTDEDKLRKKELLEKTGREVGAESIEKMLKGFERELWEYAPFVSKINEVGTSVEAGVAGGGKLGRLGAFIVLGAGVSINVDPKEKALVLELFQDVEWAKTALPGYIGAEAFASLFGNASYHDWKEPLRPEKGAALSVPGLAGCVTDKNARVGIAKGLGLGFPGAAVLTSSIVRIPLV